MIISEKQREYICFYSKERRVKIDVNNREEMMKAVVYALFEMYIIANNENDKMETAWMIYRLKDDIKEKFKLRYLIEDEEEFYNLIKRKIKQIQESTKKSQKRRHEKREDFALTNEEWNEIVGYFDFKCAYCGEQKKVTYDHFYPFSKGGDFRKGNIIPACTSCNSSKHNKLFQEWYPKQKFYSPKRLKKVLEYIEFNKQLALF